MECSICGISDKMRNVSQALGTKGIVFACDRCASNEGFVTVKKPKVIEPARESVYERMARLAGVEAKPQPERPLLRGQEKNLRQIVDTHYEKKIAPQKFLLKKRMDLVDNFHWMIMRVRRVKGLTQAQLAERINEPEAAIKMAEQGVIPEGYALVDKLEHFLRIKIIRQRDLSLPIKRQEQHLARYLGQEKKSLSEQINVQAKVEHQKNLQHMPAHEHGERKITFDRHTASALTIADLKRIKELKKQEYEDATNELERMEEYESARPYDRLDYE